MNIVQKVSVFAALTASSLPAGFRELEATAKFEPTSAMRVSFIAQEQTDPLEIGSSLPAVKFDSLNAEKIDTAEFAKGKYTLVDFWGPWCGYCVQELPELKKLHTELSGQKFGEQEHQFQMLSISANFESSHRARWKQHISFYNLDWPGHLETDNLEVLQKTFGVRGYPTKILLDPEGTVIAINPSLTSVRDTIETHANQ